MELYSGIDLHSNNSHVAIIDDQQRRVFYRKLPNDKEVIENAFAPYREWLKGIVIESTFNWYWLVDHLMEKESAKTRRIRGTEEGGRVLDWRMSP